MSGIGLRYLKEWDINPRQSAVRIDMIPVCQSLEGGWINAITLRAIPTDWVWPLAGHAGACAKVTQATITGKSDATCSCGAQP